MKSVLVIYDGQIFDVTNFIGKHPGDGINNNYLENFHKKDITEIFNRTHLSDKPYDLLETSIDEYDTDIDYPNHIKVNSFNILGSKNKKKNFICYVSPYFFKNSEMIPDYFYFNPLDIYGDKYLENKPDKFFICRRSNSETNTSVYITYKDKNSIKHLKVEKKNGHWITYWYFLGDIETIKYNNLEELITYLMDKKGLICSI